LAIGMVLGYGEIKIKEWDQLEKDKCSCTCPGSCMVSNSMIIGPYLYFNELNKFFELQNQFLNPIKLSHFANVPTHILLLVQI
jgi:hypothetical protein